MTHAVTSIPEPITLSRRTVLHLPDGPRLRPLTADDAFWEHTSDQPELHHGRVLSVFDYEKTWTYRERHPVGDELVYLIDGRVTFDLEGASDTWSVDLEPGTAVIVPENTWHRAIVHQPSRILFVSPTPALTEHEPASQ